MKVLLTKDVAKLGKSGDIVEVSDGYAQNFLFPRGLAKNATEGTIRSKKKEQSEEKQRKAREKKRLEDLAKLLTSKRLQIPLHIGENGKAFGSISSSDIAQLLGEAHKVEVSRSSVLLKKPLKQLGSFDIPLKLAMGVKGAIPIEVVEQSS